MSADKEKPADRAADQPLAAASIKDSVENIFFGPGFS